MITVAILTTLFLPFTFVAVRLEIYIIYEPEQDINYWISWVPQEAVLRILRFWIIGTELNN